jgi:hypothetical protein
LIPLQRARDKLTNITLSLLQSIYEAYHSQPQTAARQHPGVARARTFANRLWTFCHKRGDDDDEDDNNNDNAVADSMTTANKTTGAVNQTHIYSFDPDRDYSYLDRLRMRAPGDTGLSLGPVGICVHLNHRFFIVVAVVVAVVIVSASASHS